MAIPPSPAYSPDPAPDAKPDADRPGVRVQRSALVAYPPERMYALVVDCERYPQWFDWCTAGRVLAREGNRVQAELTVRVAGISAKFSTENVEQPPNRLDIRLLEGPFRQLVGAWTFDPVGAIGTRVGLDLSFEVNSSLMASALSLGFRRLADRMVEDFCRTARTVYGRQ